MMAWGLLDRGSISLRQRELMILRTTARCGAEYERGVHVAAYGAGVGWQPAEPAIVQGDAQTGAWPDEQALLVHLADALHKQYTVGDALWQSLAARFSDTQLIELITLAGLYHAVSYLANALRLAPEPFAPRFAAA